MGISSYHGPVFMQYVRMEQLKQKGEVVDACFGIQTIVIHDLNASAAHEDAQQTQKIKSI